MKGKKCSCGCHHGCAYVVGCTYRQAVDRLHACFDSCVDPQSDLSARIPQKEGLKLHRGLVSGISVTLRLRGYDLIVRLVPTPTGIHSQNRRITKARSTGLVD